MGSYLRKTAKEIDEEEKREKTFFGFENNLIQNETKLYFEVDELFSKHDTDNDGVINKEEFVLSLKEALLRNKKNSEVKERIEAFMEQMIIPEDKSFTVQSYRSIMSPILVEEFTMNEMIDLFKTFDKKKIGLISARDLTDVFQSLGSELALDTAQAMIKEASVNNVDCIDFEEFCRVILSK